MFRTQTSKIKNSLNSVSDELISDQTWPWFGRSPISWNLNWKHLVFYQPCWSSYIVCHYIAIWKKSTGFHGNKSKKFFIILYHKCTSRELLCSNLLLSNMRTLWPLKFFKICHYFMKLLWIMTFCDKNKSQFYLDLMEDIVEILI